LAGRPALGLPKGKGNLLPRKPLLPPDPSLSRLRIIEQHGGPHVFMRHSAIQGGGFKTLAEDEQVEFEVVQGPKDPKAENIKRTEA